MSLQIVRSVRANFPTPLGPSHPKFLVDLITALGPEWGLLIKTGGTRITLPDGVSVSQDCVTDKKGIQVDCLADGEGSATPTWNEVERDKYTPDPARFYRPSGLQSVPPSAPQTPPPTAPPTVDRLDEIEEALAQLAIAASQSFAKAEGAINDLFRRLQRLEEDLAKPRTIEGRTDSRGFGPLSHSHYFKAEVK